MRSPRVRVVLSLALLGLVASANAQSQGVAWRTDLQSAQAEAQQSGKLVLAHFWTETCGPCKALELRVFNQPAVAMALDAEYVPVKINANEAPELAERYQITRVPTDAVLSPNGELVSSFVSPATPMEYIGHLSRLASAYKSRLGQPYAAAVAAAPASAPVAKNTAYAQLAAQSPPPAPPAVTPAPVATANPHFSHAPAAPQPQQQAAVTPVESPAPKPAAVQLPPGSPPLGFEGYCPVTMKGEWRWAQGDVRFGAIHQGRTYLFVSAAAQQAFLANPDAYSPVLSGADPVVAVDERRSVAGQRDFAVQYPTGTGRFYLFSSEKSLEKFWTNPDAYAKGAQRVAALPAAGRGTLVR